MASKESTRVTTALLVVFVLLVLIGNYKKSLYGYCISIEMCEMPALDGLDIRMKSNWLPEIYDLDGRKLLAFEKNGQSRSDGGLFIKFVSDPISAKMLATRFTKKSYSWGIGYEGDSEMMTDFISMREPASYLVIPEMGLLIVSNNPSSFTDIVKLAATPLPATRSN